ncbi:G-type lectin S-receptor-like serine/threonine-protein kinase LECRK3 [Gastrolobium bilobum]|uniref:G-type lectin S-receptor-like serine/threonine-protein kinase LECRK3 n=1 Tax=Gastrolobium bilobum TaxID=150636 RepID=UPI002AAFEF91|nr:G-type lectin S-receptor-like serine/threonine-protein kinase LECRK3 [Gastrolobium bilobum]XP_061368284.1 G-type lectin S-receptor-like serine/threonine-protein kinase LECRK3 [Gastrolobium bilobum]
MAALTLLILTLVFLQVLLVVANVNLNSTLTTNDNDAWLSPLGDFAFGFRPLNDTSTSLFMVAIWYNKIPDMTVVWNAKAADDNNVVKAPTGSQVQLTSQGLTLTNPNGESIWTAQPNAVVSNGTMLDTGNFVLLNNNSTSVWESFKNPTDTLLPNQSLETDGKLTCRFTETNYTRGRFQLYFQNGDVFLKPLSWPSEFRYDPYYKIDAAASASQLVFDESGNIYAETTNGTRFQPQSPKWVDLTLDPKENYYRATLDFHGVFTQYAHSRNSSAQQGWSILRYVPSNICNSINNEMGSGTCWYNSICSMENQRPTCKCPYGYSLVDPNNAFGGCQPNFTLVCGADVEGLQARPEELYDLPISIGMNFPFGDYERIEPYTQDECKQSCLHDCMCAVAILGGSTCWKKRLPLINGRVDAGNQLVFIKTRITPLSKLDPGAKQELPTGPDSNNEDRAKPILRGSLIGSLVLNSILLATVVLILLLKPKRIVQASSLLETNLHSFTYEALKVATWGFKEELGRGSFGIVYKGKVEAASCDVVAVKKLDRLAQEREKEFKTELSAIGKTCHKNLVRLIGFCDEGIHRLIVYEFMSNGTLADILFGQANPIWNLRVRFALDIARGLVYLHEECDTPIIHCDIKPQNILIDEHFTAKISDFGLAKLLLSDQSRTNTMIRGTRGYVAPEWFKNVPVTVKVDVYSFGVMLLEIICCRKSVQLTESGEEESAILIDWAYDCYIEKRIDVLVENDPEALADIGRLQSWIKIAIWCIQEHHEMRPTMGKVMQMLQGSVEVPKPPLPSSFNSI